MNISLTEKLRRVLPSDVFTDTELAGVIGGSDDRRYGQTRRALARGDIIRLKRGVYALGRHHQHEPPNRFEIAQKVYAPSYVSLESALSYHGWIPEAAYTTTSVSAKRSREFETPLGLFSYQRIPGFNFSGVERVKSGRAIFLLASAGKALLDYVYSAELGDDVGAVIDSLRIEVESLQELSLATVRKLANSYRSRRISRFANALEAKLR